MKEENQQNNKVFWILPLVVMAIGLLPMPYGYYSISRLVVCGCSIFFTLRLVKTNQRNLAWLFGGIAVLYNPLIPVHLNEKAFWIIVNIATAIIFIVNRKKINS